MADQVGTQATRTRTTRRPTTITRRLRLQQATTMSNARTDVVAVHESDAPLDMQRAASACRLLIAIYGDDNAIEFAIDNDTITGVRVTPTPTPGGNQ